MDVGGVGVGVVMAVAGEAGGVRAWCERSELDGGVGVAVVGGDVDGDDDVGTGEAGEAGEAEKLRRMDGEADVARSMGVVGGGSGYCCCGGRGGVVSPVMGGVLK